MSRSLELFSQMRTRGKLALDELIESRASEELFLDFKRSGDDGAGRTLHESDRKNYAKAISGFANSEGGVIVWGVDCRPDSAGADIARSCFPLNDARAFLSRLEGATSGCTVPACPNVEHFAMDVDGARGYVVTHVPKSYLAPHQCLKPVNYFMRAGSDFLPVPHGVLQGLFGRRTASPIFHMWGLEPATTHSSQFGTSVNCAVQIIISTYGPGIVRDMFLNVYAYAPNGGSSIEYEFPASQHWTSHTYVGRVFSISAENFKLAPEMMTVPMKLRVNLKPPFLSDWKLVMLYGHGESSTTRLEFRVSSEELTTHFAAYVQGRGASERDFLRLALGLAEREPLARSEP